MATYKIGDMVECRLYNTPDRKFYGPCFTGIIEDIEVNDFNASKTRYLVVSEEKAFPIWLVAKEIKRKVQKREHYGLGYMQGKGAA